jgi:alpha-L-rhamnosidase
MRGNFLDVPTDCPQRDERLGWTGDIQVFAPTACFLYDAAGFLASWLADLAADQRDDGAVPFVIPNALRFVIPAAAWGDAATIVPWVLYQRTGDEGVLRTQYPSMRPGPITWSRRPATTGCGTTASSSATGSTPRAAGQPVRRPHRRPPGGQRLPGPLARHRAPHGLAARRVDDVARYEKLAARCAAAFAGEYVTPTAASPRTARPPTRWRCSSACCRPRATCGTGPGGGLAELVRADRPHDRHRASWARRWSATRCCATGHGRRRLPPAAPDQLPVVALSR